MSLIKYISAKCKRRFATTAAEKYPAQDVDQENYRDFFGGIVDQYLIYCDYNSQKQDEGMIVYIDADTDVDWIDKKGPKGDDWKQRNMAISKLDIAQASPVHNLNHTEVLTFKKLLGVGYNAALHENFNEVDIAIDEAMKYRADRNKEKSRLMLLGSATIYMFLLAVLYCLFIHLCPTHPHFFWFTGMTMGAVGAYVSIWTRYGKLDMTGLGVPVLHYLESFCRMFIGSVFAAVLLLAVEAEIFVPHILENIPMVYVYSILGFIAGFSEQLVPSVLEKFIGKETENKTPEK